MAEEINRRALFLVDIEVHRQLVASARRVRQTREREVVAVRNLKLLAPEPHNKNKCIVTRFGSGRYKEVAIPNAKLHRVLSPCDA